jgi:hypothetical protein
MFRVSHRGEGIDDAESIGGARAIVRGQPPGRYDVDEIRAEAMLRDLEERLHERKERRTPADHSPYRLADKEAAFIRHHGR